MDLRGRWTRRNKRSIADNSLILDISKLSKRVNLAIPRSGQWYWNWPSRGEANVGYQVLPNYGVRLIYQQAGVAYDYNVRTVTTDCHYGGSRYWFLCPNQHCQKRVRILHLDRYFLCRMCAGCDYYQSQQSEDMIARIDGEIKAIQRKLGAKDAHIEEPELDRPKGMHFERYAHITERYWVLQECRCLAWLIMMTRMAQSMGTPTGRSVSGMTEQLRWLLKQRTPFTLNMKNWI
jgi:hypothetical protein